MNAVHPKGTPWGDAEGRRHDILEAAKELLAEVGYAELGMRALAERAGIAAGTLYRYFGTKEEIFLTIYSERIDQLGADARIVGREAKSLEELIRRFADGYLAFHREVGRQLNVLAVLADPKVVAHLPAELTTRMQVQVAEIFIETAERVDELARAEGRELIDPSMTVPLLWSALGGLAEGYAGARASAQPFPWEEMVAFAAQTLVRGLTKPKKTARRKKR
jgi:AcrR family transcriptional regulator